MSQDIRTLRSGAVMPDQSSRSSALGGIAGVQSRRAAGGSIRFPDNASRIRYLQGVVRVQQRRALTPVYTPAAITTLTPAPTNLSFTTGIGRIFVAFTQQSTSSPITNYLYSFDGATFIECSPAITSSPVPVPVSGLSGTVYLKARTSSEDSAASLPLSYSLTVQRTIATDTVNPTAWLVPENVTEVEYLVVGGGGGGGAAYDTGSGGGGGAGVVLSGTKSVISGTTYSLQVGAGGEGGSHKYVDPAILTETSGVSGNPSVFIDISANGGGGGKASRTAPGGVGLGGTAQNGEIPATGGNGGGSVGSTAAAGGGGGASGAGGTSTTSTGGVGGSGIASNISGSATTYGVGGAGGNENNGTANGLAGTTNCGNGGGGGKSLSAAGGKGGNGGSGIIILKYYV